MDHLHWQMLRDNTSIMKATATLMVLALATLCDVTQIGLFLFMSLRPRWPRQEHHVLLLPAFSRALSC